jgi:hypothetical protein
VIERILQFIRELLQEIDEAPESMYRSGMEDGLRRVEEFIEDEWDE